MNLKLISLQLYVHNKSEYVRGYIPARVWEELVGAFGASDRRRLRRLRPLEQGGRHDLGLGV